MSVTRSALLTAAGPVLRHSRWRDPGCLRQQLRRLSLHEFQSQEVLHGFGLAVPRGKVAGSASEAAQVVHELGSRCNLKPQVLSRTRPRADAPAATTTDASAAEAAAAEMFASTQTGNNQVPVHHVYVEEAVEHDQQSDLILGIDQENCCPKVLVRMHSRLGTTGEGEQRVFKLALSEGIPSSVAAEISSFLEIPADSGEDMGRILGDLYRLFVEKDAVELRVKLLHSAQTGGILCSSAELTIDDAASKRQPELFSMRDTKSEVPEELEAEAAGLVYVKMDGTIGNVVNGAGLAMATNDAIASCGGSSANFLDTGGQATEATMQKAFGIILRDPRVKAILVNIYGGIIRCDMIAASIISTAETLGPMKVPIVVRLQGTNSEEGLHLLKEANLRLFVESDFGQAAARAVQLAGR